jgi:Histone deacetylation protein Rxt3
MLSQVCYFGLTLVIFHSGHYRPVDAPDPFPENPDAPSVTQAALVKGDSGKQTQSSITVKSAIQSQISPVIAHIDSANSSSTTLLPDHDLYVTLRVLPKLVRYTGSTRYGLDSK